MSTREGGRRRERRKGVRASDHEVVVGNAAAGALATDAQEDRRVGVVEVGLEVVVALAEGAAILRREVVEALRQPEGLLRDIVIGGEEARGTHGASITTLRLISLPFRSLLVVQDDILRASSSSS
jgi:hypothetical protein